MPGNRRITRSTTRRASDGRVNLVRTNFRRQRIQVRNNNASSTSAGAGNRMRTRNAVLRSLTSSSSINTNARINNEAYATETENLVQTRYTTRRIAHINRRRQATQAQSIVHFQENNARTRYRNATEQTYANNTSAARFMQETNAESSIRDDIMIQHYYDLQSIQRNIQIIEEAYLYDIYQRFPLLFILPSEQLQLRVLLVIGTVSHAVNKAQNLFQHLTTGFDSNVESRNPLICSICMNPYAEREPTVIYCGHIYCQECIIRHMESENPICPVCSFSIAGTFLKRLFP